MSRLTTAQYRFAALILGLGLLALVPGVGAQTLTPSPDPSQDPATHPPLETPVVIPATSNDTSTTPAATAPPETPFKKIVINIPSHMLFLEEITPGHADDQPQIKILRQFPVGVGRPGYPTPIGHFQVVHMVKNPAWENPYKAAGAQRIAAGKTNPLGTRWIGFDQTSQGEYGMHGTDTPASVGKYSSHGCVRMQVKDAEALFDQVAMGTPVDVEYDPAPIKIDGNKIELTTYADAYHLGMPGTDLIIQKIKTCFPQAVINREKISQLLRFPAQQPAMIGTTQPAEENTATSKAF